jgi:sugar lactone lactonase YvrE
MSIRWSIVPPLQAGQREVIIHSLTGLPAGIAKASDGNYWLSMTVPVPPVTR